MTTPLRPSAMGRPWTEELTMSTASLAAAVSARYGETAATVVRHAFVVADRAHAGQLRRSGDPYITHPLAVARILADVGVDAIVVAAALLHDVPTNTRYGLSEIRAEFGVKIAALVEAFIQLDEAGDRADIDGTDPWVLTMKVADRLHNMQTIGFLNRETQQLKAESTLRLVAPAADSLGLIEIRDELERLARATLRSDATLFQSHAGPAESTRIGGPTVARGILRFASHLLPVSVRTRWFDEWNAEMHSLDGRHRRVIFAVDVLCGVPYMALLTRRSAVPRTRRPTGGTKR